MKKFLLAAILLISSYVGFSQQLSVQSNNKGLYISHTVQSKENFYSIGRTYNISPKEIAAFNTLDMNQGLSVGQTVLIPLTEANFSQKIQKGVPVYYTVGEKEGLYRVSLKNNNVLMADLRKWNKLANDNISTGQKLIVGYLTATDVPASSVAKTAATPPPATIANPEPKEEKTVSAPVAVEKKSEPIREAPQQASRPAAPAGVQQVASGTAGYFKSQYEAQTRKTAANNDQTATAGIFKTASGWQDAKYYALIDKVEPGTIIQVVNPTNNKSIYAKVLGEMSGIRQNQGLELRLSNAAASALDISETDKFIVRINY